MPRKSIALDKRDRGHAFSIYFPASQINGDVSEVMRLVDSESFSSISEFVQVAVREKIANSKLSK